MLGLLGVKSWQAVPMHGLAGQRVVRQAAARFGFFTLRKV